jgi:hypothetical protein
MEEPGGPDVDAVVVEDGPPAVMAGIFDVADCRSDPHHNQKRAIRRFKSGLSKILGTGGNDRR